LKNTNSNVVSLSEYREKKAQHKQKNTSPAGMMVFVSFVWVPVYFYMGIPGTPGVNDFDYRKVMNSRNW